MFTFVLSSGFENLIRESEMKIEWNTYNKPNQSSWSTLIEIVRVQSFSHFSR